MLEVARSKLSELDEQSASRVQFIQSTLEEYSDENSKYDVVVAGLVLHYIKNITPLFQKINRWLAPGGIFVFSTEHPIATSAQGIHPSYVKDEEGNILYFIYDNYHQEGLRTATWYVEGVRRYHRKFETFINTLVETGFLIDRVSEPSATPEAEEREPNLKKCIGQRRASFLCIRAKKP
jgi:SAM-dependent methyltransferase